MNYLRAGDTGGRRQGTMPPPPPHPTPTFLRSKKKNGNKGKSRKDLKAETIKRLSPRLKCYCFSHSRAPRIQIFFLSANHGGRQNFTAFLAPSTLKLISPALYLQSNNLINLEVGFSPSKKVILINFHERSLKMIEIAFYFMLKALFVLVIFTFLS